MFLVVLTFFHYPICFVLLSSGLVPGGVTTMMPFLMRRLMEEECLIWRRRSPAIGSALTVLFAWKEKVGELRKEGFITLFCGKSL